jgi:hypothetical protein
MGDGLPKQYVIEAAALRDLLKKPRCRAARQAVQRLMDEQDALGRVPSRMDLQRLERAGHLPGVAAGMEAEEPAKTTAERLGIPLQKVYLYRDLLKADVEIRVALDAGRIDELTARFLGRVQKRNWRLRALEEVQGTDRSRFMGQSSATSWIQLRWLDAAKSGGRVPGLELKFDRVKRRIIYPPAYLAVLEAKGRLGA